MLINPLKSSTKVVLSLSVGPADYLHKRRTICRVSLKHERTTAQLNCDRQVHTYGMTARSCGITDMHAAKIHYCKFFKNCYRGSFVGVALFTEGFHRLPKAALCIRRTRTQTLCIRRNLCRHVTDDWYIISHFCCFDSLLTVFDEWYTVGTVL